MDQQQEPTQRPVEVSLKATYRALLARGLQPGEAANLTAYLHGLPSAGFQWTLPEVQAIVRQRLDHAATIRATARTRTPATAGRPSPKLGAAIGARARARRHAPSHVFDEQSL
jgi:hypothetical protein